MITVRDNRKQVGTQQQQAGDIVCRCWFNPEDLSYQQGFAKAADFPRTKVPL
jgi:hypothetical protein